jgi:hypothetical protein
VSSASAATRSAVIAQHREQHAVVTMCRVLAVSKAGYYARRDWEPSTRTRANERLAAEITDVHRRCRRTSGSPRIHADLGARGHRMSVNRVARVTPPGSARTRDGASW